MITIATVNKPVILSWPSSQHTNPVKTQQTLVIGLVPGQWWPAANHYDYLCIPCSWLVAGTKLVNIVLEPLSIYCAKLWRALKRRLSNCKKTDTICNINGKTNPLELVNELNEFFANIGSKLADDIEPSNLELDFTPNQNIPLLELRHTAPVEVLTYLNKISDSKATGEDGIPICFLKMVPDIVSTIISYIINLTIDTE